MAQGILSLKGLCDCGEVVVALDDCVGLLLEDEEAFEEEVELEVLERRELLV